MSAKRPPWKKGAAPLERYHSKRDFEKTPEPAAKRGASTGHSFVIQEHHARSHHFDFRLEMDGVLVSWAVPKGIPDEPSAKRLAVHVEDHPLDYGSFEGVIPKGNYGAGTVAIWDRGQWNPLDKDWRKAFQDGKLKFALKGERIEGIYLLARMGEEPNWLLRKLQHDLPAAENSAERETAEFVSPQLAHVVPSVPSGKEWLHEIKFDGYRLIAVHANGALKLYTRNRHDWTDRFRQLAARLAKLTSKDFVLDGEAVVFDAKGRSSFGDLQAALKHGKDATIEFVAFDLLHFDGHNLRDLALTHRLEKLAELAEGKENLLRISKVWPANQGKELFQQACANGLEGIVSKNSQGRYQPESRRSWTKSKCRARQEFVICGFTAPKGSLADFGALILASFEHDMLIPRGKVGTGFSAETRERLIKRFKPLITLAAAFPSDEKEVTWLKPQLVAEIEFAEITRDGSIRQGSFIALREDKLASDVHLDSVQTTAADSKDVKVAGIAISHPERMVYPADEVTKLEVVRYYERVGENMLPYVAGRPLAVLRGPDGIEGDLFFQKSFNSHLPKHVFQTELADGTSVFYIKKTDGLVALAQFGVIEFHPWGARLADPERPDLLIWDLDPDPSVPWPEVQGTAVLLRDYLADLGLETLIKTSGGKGLHIVLHLKRKHEWDPMREFAKAVAQELVTFNPKRLISTATKAKRTGKIYIDWMRNGRGSTCIAPWALRARQGAAVSMPVNWGDIVQSTAAAFTIRDAPAVPSEWLKPEPQTITVAALRKLRLV